MKTKIQATILGILAGVALLSAREPAFANADSMSANTSVVVTPDQQLANKVASAVRRYPYYGVFDWVTGTIKDGVVTLDGAVHQPGRKDDYMRLAAAVPGVKKVVNNLQVLPTSLFDDDLRLGAARAIYRNQDFLYLSIQPNPPVHIIVENGRIRLEGVVHNQMERQLAEVAVRSRTMAFEVVNDLKIES